MWTVEEPAVPKGRAVVGRYGDWTKMAETAEYEVLIEGKAYPWEKETISAGDIRELANFPPDAQVVEEDLRDGTERALAEDEMLRPGKLEGGKRPTKRVNFRQR
jgi:hypothetical protein